MPTKLHGNSGGYRSGRAYHEQCPHMPNLGNQRSHAALSSLFRFVGATRESDDRLYFQSPPPLRNLAIAKASRFPLLDILVFNPLNAAP